MSKLEFEHFQENGDDLSEAFAKSLGRVTKWQYSQNLHLASTIASRHVPEIYALYYIVMRYSIPIAAQIACGVINC